ncbi:MAG: DUF2461 domain-containing protein [Candidatus Kapaibacterium sp.]|nr:DUF2461 domain-containing protein [Bacteroidota bacterium]
MSAHIEKATLQFLCELAENNNRDWFTANKERYTTAHQNIITFTDSLLAEMRKHDAIETPSAKESLMRIYRDTRFSADKTPYKTYFGGGFTRATNKLRGGYYFQISAENTFAAGGFYAPNPDDLLRIRKDIDINYPDWVKMLNSKPIANTFGALQGEKVATAPKGFSKTNPAIELLRHKQFYFMHQFTAKEVTSSSFLKELNQTFKNLRPYFDYMSDVLTTDANGVPLV